MKNKNEQCKRKEKYTMKYTPINSGSSYSINARQILELEKNGWVLDFFDGTPNKELYIVIREKNLNSANKMFASESEAIKEFMEITGIDLEEISEEGCPCCGPPHRFSWWDGHDFIEEWSGSHINEII